MYTKQPKKFLILNILDILKKYTDSDHRLDRNEIKKILENEYDMTATPKSIVTNIKDLIEYGYDIEYDETPRTMKMNGEEVENNIRSGYYLNKDFTDSELRLLIDGLLFSKYIPHNQCKALIEKLEDLSNKYFRARVKHIRNLPENLPKNSELFYTIDILDEAITNNKQVSFTYNEYGTDKKLHKRKSNNNEDRKYIINPYQMVATNGRYYLICNLNWCNNLSNYRLDKITNIKILDKKAKPKSEVKGLENGLDLPKHMAEHIYMFSGESKRVKFIAKKYIITAIIDWFGLDVDFSGESEEDVIVSVVVNEEAMRYWAMQYANHIKVISPQSLVDTIKSDLENAFIKYSN